MTQERTPQEKPPEGESLRQILERLDALEKMFKHGTKEHKPPVAPQPTGTAAVIGDGPAPANERHVHALHAHDHTGDTGDGGALTTYVEVAGDTMTGNLTHANNVGLKGTTTGAAVKNLALLNSSNNVILGDADQATHIYGTELLHNGDAADKLWRAGNDGTGSGLDADTVDGSHASAFSANPHGNSNHTAPATPGAVAATAATGSDNKVPHSDHVHANQAEVLAGVAGFPIAQSVICSSVFVAGTGATATTTNDAHLMPVVVPKEVTITKIRIAEVITSSGNINVGVFNSALTSLRTSGSVACPAAGVDRDVSLSSSLTFGPGLYYFAIAMDNTTASIRRFADVALGGITRDAGNFALGDATASSFPSVKWFALGGVP